LANYTLARLIYELDITNNGFDGKLENAEKSVKKFEETCKKSGESLSKFVTLPLIALGTAAVKFAADQEVQTRRFATAYKDNIGAASDAVKLLTTQYKMSESQAMEFLGTTGNIAKALGLSGPAALKTATDIAKLSAALAAFSGKSMEEANSALNALLMGNARGMREFGIAIKDTAVEEELARTGQDKLTGTLLDQAKAQVALKIVTSASKDALADFDINSAGAAFRTRELIEQAKEAAESLGMLLLPAFKDLLGMVGDAIKWFSGLDEGTKKTIIVLAALAAAAGPVISAIGGIGKAFNFLLANPYLLVIAGIIAAFATMIGIARNLSAAFDPIKRAEKATADLDVANKNLESSLKALDKANKDLAASTSDLTEEEKLNYENKVKMANASVEGNARAQMIALNDLANAMDGLHGNMERNIEAQKELKAQGDALIDSGESYFDVQTLSITTMRKASEWVGEVSKKYGELESKYNESSVSFEKGLDVLNRMIAAGKVNVEQLQKEFPWLAARINNTNKDAAATEKATKTEQARTRAIQDTTEARKKSLELLKSLQDGELSDMDKLVEKYREVYNSKLNQEEKNRAYAILDRQRAQMQIDDAKKVHDEILAYEEDQAAVKKQHLEEEKAQREAFTSQAIGLYSEFASAINSIVGNVNAGRAQALDEESQARIDALDKQLLGEEEYNKQVQAIERETALKKWELEVETMRTKQVTDTASVAINTAVAITKALADLGPIFGPIMTGLIIGLAALQTAAIWSQPTPPRPRLAEGALVQAVQGGVGTIVGEGRHDEAVLPLSDAIFARIAAGIVAANQGQIIRDQAQGQPTTFIVNLDGQPLAAFTVNAINGGRYTINAGAVK
jgi:hypothetical protein